MPTLLRTFIAFAVTLLTLQTAVATPAPKEAHSRYIFTTDSLYRHIAVLSSDSLEGREVGEAGEMKAARYLMDVFRRAGVTPIGDSGDYLQPFTFIKRIQATTNCRLSINGTALKLDDEFRPLDQSASVPFQFSQVIPVNYGITVSDSSFDDYASKDVAGKAVLIKRFAPDDTTGHIDWDKYSSITDKVLNATAHKATGIFFYTPNYQDDTLLRRGVTHVAPKDIPIILLRRAAMEKLGFDANEPPVFSAEGFTEIERVPDTGYNVVGYVPGVSDTTIIIGAHYDHLGWGTPASLYHGKVRKIHHGADDNGSGTATLLELARYYTALEQPLHHSLLFIAFSGEEAGLLGSTYFTKHMTIDASKVSMMINIDMIGRLKDQQHGLAVFGTGTCTEFKNYFDSLHVPDIKLTIRAPGTGPSDHTPFYNAGIPVLYFFTGAHADYHRPTDTIDKLDFPGIVKVAQLVTQVVNHFDRERKPLVFQRTREPERGHGRRNFTVTLGITPDFIADVKGLAVSGVTPDNPADHAGVKKGDVIIGIGRYAVDDIYTYMNALGKFHKGDSTTIRVVRGEDTLSLPAIF